MTIVKWIAPWLLALGLAPAWASTGADVATLINQRYQSDPDSCYVSQPAYACSGVMMRFVPDGSASFWQLDAGETSSGTAMLNFVRRDQALPKDRGTTGFVLATLPDALANDRDYALRCGCPPPGQQLPACGSCPVEPTSVGVSAWDTAKPAALAVQAIFYDAAVAGTLAQALQYQKQYFDATQQWVPVLRVAFDENGATSFGFDQRSQLDWGYRVAQDLDGRFFDTGVQCPGAKPAYYCNGVLIRSTGYGDTFHSWNPSPTSVARNGVSFSYVRTDNMKTVVVGPGMIMNGLQAPTAYPLTVRCAFPTNAITNSRSDSCNTGSDARLCDARGIVTASQWTTAYGTDSDNACGLAPTQAQFDVMVQLRQMAAFATAAHDELVIAAWPQDIPTQLPLQAFYYSTESTKVGAQTIQQDYLRTTGQFMPVMQVDLSQPSGKVFVYDPDMQLGAFASSKLPIYPNNPRFQIGR